MALKDALASVYWYKSDLKQFLAAEVGDNALVSGIDWAGQYKRDSIEEFVQRLLDGGSRTRETLIQLMVDVAAIDDFPGLRKTDDPAKKIAEAKEAISRVQRYVQPYEKELLEQEQARTRIATAKARAEESRATSRRLEELKTRFFELVAMDDAQRRGFAFEVFLRDLFDTFDLDPRASFKVEGEQVDGGFSLEGTYFVLEARWRRDPADRADLDVFAAKVAAKAENTLGLFVSVEGFVPEGVAKHAGRQSALVLMDGGDVLAVLEERLDLVELLRRKRRHASMTGEIYLRADQILG